MVSFKSSLSLTIITFLFLLLVTFSTAEDAIGVNYGTEGDNLPPPSKVVEFLKNQTKITHVKIFDHNLDVIKAFANSQISLTITIPNDAVTTLSKESKARKWVKKHIRPFYPTTKIKRILVGNEILTSKNKVAISYIVRTMKVIREALHDKDLGAIQVSTPHSLNILSLYDPPSSGRFRHGLVKERVTRILKFHRKTKTPFMVSPYPFFVHNKKNLDYALFKPNKGIMDKRTGLNYTNMFDAHMDAFYSAMKKVGYEDVEIAVAETGWSSLDNVEDAASYNGNLLKHVNSGKGTPMMPKKNFEAYIFALFHENLKVGVSKHNFGLFGPDFKPTYDSGLLR